MFDPKLHGVTPRHVEIYGTYERVYTFVDLAAGLTFVVGSILFFEDSLVYSGTWCFLLGSICFAVRPLVRFLREYHLARLPLPGDDPRVGPDGVRRAG